MGLPDVSKKAGEADRSVGLVGPKPNEGELIFKKRWSNWTHVSGVKPGSTEVRPPLQRNALSGPICQYMICGGRGRTMERAV